MTSAEIQDYLKTAIEVAKLAGEVTLKKQTLLDLPVNHLDSPTEGNSG